MIFTSPPAKLGVSDPKGLDVTIVTLRPVVAQTATHFVNLPVGQTPPAHREQGESVCHRAPARWRSANLATRQRSTRYR